MLSFFITKNNETNMKTKNLKSRIMKRANKDLDDEKALSVLLEMLDENPEIERMFILKYKKEMDIIEKGLDSPQRIIEKANEANGKEGGDS